ncbi:MAG: aminotransferase class V-fold PLP-dependent enzyme [Dongiaceae bacterium]
MGTPLDKTDFHGLDGIAHLAAGGETPPLFRHTEAAGQFLADKALGMPGRQRFFAVIATLRERLARLLGGVPAADIGLLASASQGLYAAASGIDWRPGDNVVTALSEFPSVLHACSTMPGVELRAVGAAAVPTLEEIAAAVDGRTRMLAVSHVSYLTGARVDLAALRAIADRVGARLVVDASHALGVVAVDGALCDVVVSCAYKWMLGCHGIGLFFVNGRRWPDLAAPWMGWHSLRGEEDWRKRAVALPKETMERFEAGNPAFLPGYLLNEGTGTLLAAGVAAIEGHVAPLAGSLRDGLVRLGLPVLTPAPASDRAGNICFATERSMALEEGLREAGVLTWGGDGRLRISVHGYNDEGDVARALDTLRRLGA